MDGRFYAPTFAVEGLDATSAGDCFFDYFLARVIATDNVETILRLASAAAATQITRTDAAKAVPSRQDVLAFTGICEPSG